MTPQNEPREDARLDKTLREWTLTEPLPPRFQEQVWQRIASAEAAPGSGLSGLLRSWMELLPRPKFAVAYLAILLAAGLAAGSWAAQAKASQLESNLGLRYVQAIDPYRGEAAVP